MNTQKTLIACVGNMLMLDEGFGPYMAAVLTERERAAEFFDDEHVEKIISTFRIDQDGLEDERIPVLDAGTMGMGMVPYIRDYDRIIVIDVIDCGPESGVEPGTVYVLKPEDMAENTVLHSLHDIKLIDVLTNAALAGHEADVDCICVQCGDIFPKELTIDLTPKVKAAVPQVMGALMELIGE